MPEKRETHKFVVGTHNPSLSASTNGGTFEDFIDWVAMLPGNLLMVGQWPANANILYAVVVVPEPTTITMSGNFVSSDSNEFDVGGG